MRVFAVNGSPEFAAAVERRLRANGHEDVLVVSEPTQVPTIREVKGVPCGPDGEPLAFLPMTENEENVLPLPSMVENEAQVQDEDDVVLPLPSTA